MASKRWWRPALHEHRKSGHRGPGDFIFSDWRGCGENEAWPRHRPLTVEDLARDQIELLNHLEFTNDVSLVGHSLGGLIALQMMILEPQRFARAVLLDPVGLNGVVFDDSLYEVLQQMAKDPELTRSLIVSTILNGEALDEIFKSDLAKDAHKAVQGVGVAILDHLKTLQMAEKVRDLKIPILILHGEKDQIIPLGDSQAMHQCLPDSRLEILPGVGHCWNLENPNAFMARVKDFLEAE